jgi:hypothetical protein
MPLLMYFTKIRSIAIPVKGFTIVFTLQHLSIAEYSYLKLGFIACK